MRRYPLILLLSLCAVTAAIAEERPRIGISIPLTGETSTYGNDMRKTFVFANEKLTHNRYELIFEDDLCDGELRLQSQKSCWTLRRCNTCWALPAAARCFQPQIFMKRPRCQ